MFLMSAPRHIETERLVLSAPAVDDATEIFGRYASDPEVTRYLGWPTHRTVEDTAGFLAFAAAQWAESGVGPYLIRLKEDVSLIGSTGLQLEADHQAMTGYVLARDAWGQGYATEALRAMVGVASAIGVERLYALCHPDHRASWHVLEKCGFVRDLAWTRPVEFPNLAPGVLQEACCYVLTNE
jgi:[ribosomal protein S5]-alanine N-acetyltransferase